MAPSPLLAHVARADGDGDDDDGATARVAARGLARELAEATTTGREDVARAVRTLCEATTHARAQDELARGIVAIARSGNASASALATELASGAASARTRANVRALTRALVELCCAFGDGELAGECARGSGHPLVRALKAHSDAGAGLLEATASKLARGSISDFNALRQFVFRALLEHPAPAPRSSFAMLLHARLMGIASGRGENARAVLGVCVEALGAYRAPTSESRSWIACAAAEIIDAIECRLFDVEDASAREVVPLLAEGLVRQTRAAARSGDSVVPFVGALTRLSELGDVSVCGELLPCLSLVHSAEETSALLALLAPYFPTSGPARALGAMHASAAFMLPGESGARLALSLATLRNDDSARNVENSRLMGYATRDGFVSAALAANWDDGDATETLAACIRNDVDVRSPSLELACLSHPVPSIRECAAETLGRKLGGKRPQGLSNITATLLHLRAACEKSSSARHAKSTLASLNALAAGASNFMAAPAVLRAISPLMSTNPGEKSPEARLHALALRLLAEMWIHNRELGPRLRGALEEASHSHEREVTVGCAAAVAAAAKAHPFRAAELVIPMQGCLKSDWPEAQALALEAIDSMCAHDALDFLPAFKVVTRHIPSLPQHPLVARKWIRLIRHGGRDGASFPEATATLIDTVWNAIKTSKDARVRHEAWNSLSEYDPEFIIENDSPTPAEIAASALSESFGEESFVGATRMLRTMTKHEASLLSRTALVARESQQVSHPPPSDPLIYRVTQTLPKKLLDSQPCSCARLLLFRPHKGKSEATRSVDENSQRRSRAEAYRTEFKRAIRQVFWSGSWHVNLVTRAWTRFARRWFDAEVSARTAENGLDELYAEVRASINATAMEALQDVSMPDELQNIALLLATPVLVGNGGLGAALVDLLLSLLEEKSSIVGAERGLYVALGLAAGTLEDRGDAQRPNKVAEIMMKQISDCRIDGALTMGVTAEALGLMCRELSSNVLPGGSSSSWRLDLVRRIYSFLGATLVALGEPFIDVLKVQPANDIISPPKGDLSDAVCGVYTGLSRAACALDVFEDDKAMTNTLAIINWLIGATSCGRFPGSIALPVAVKSLLNHRHNTESEVLALKALRTTHDSEQPAIRAVAGIILGVTLDHGCAIPIQTVQEIIARVTSTVRDDMATSFDRSIGVLSLSGVLGSAWDGHDVSVAGTFDEGAVFSAPLLWGGDKSKIEAKRVLKTLESIAYAPGDIVSKALRDLTIWTLAGVSDRAAQIAVTIGPRSTDSKSSVPKDTIIGFIMHALLDNVVSCPSREQLNGATLALDVLRELARLPNAGWSNALHRWWRVATSSGDVDKVEKNALQCACLRMCRAHPEASIGRDVLELLVALSDADFFNLAPETQRLAMLSAPYACALRSETGASAIKRFTQMAFSPHASDGCVESLWNGLIDVSESETATAAVCELVSRLSLTDTRTLDAVSTCVSQFTSSVLREQVVKKLALDVKPIVCARLYNAGQVASETLTSLATWPKATRTVTLRATVGHLTTSSNSLRAQMIHEAANLTDVDAIPCIAILAAAWGPTSALLSMTSIEQCILALPYTLSHLLRGELSGMMETLVSCLLRNLNGKYSKVATDTLLELRDDVTLALWSQIVDSTH